MNGTLYKAEPHAEENVWANKGRRKFTTELRAWKVHAADQKPGPARMYWKIC
jgi:hypothetical protein